MGFFRRNLGQTQEEPKPQETEYHGYFVEKLDGQDMVVGEAEAMQIPSFANALELIVSSISKLDVNLYQENEKGEVTRHIKDYRVGLLNDENSYYSNAIDYKRQIVKDMLINGVSYSYLDKKGLDIKGIHKIDPNTVTIDKKANSKGIITSAKASYTMNEATLEVDLEDLLVIPFRSEDGMTGKDIFNDNQKLLRLLYQELEYSENVYKNASVPFGVLETPSKVAKDVVERLKATWSNLYKGSKNSGKIAVLENGLTYKPISQNPQDILLLDSRKANVREVEKMFNLPSGMLESEEVQDVESLYLYLRSRTLEPIIKMLESAFNKALLLEDEKEEGFYFKFDMKPLDLMKEVDKVNSVAMKMQNGIMSINEGRAEFDMKDFEGCDNLALSLGNIFIKPSGEIYVPNIEGSTSMNRYGKTQFKDKEKQDNINMKEGQQEGL